MLMSLCENSYDNACYRQKKNKVKNIHILTQIKNYLHFIGDIFYHLNIALIMQTLSLHINTTLYVLY